MSRTKLSCGCGEPAAYAICATCLEALQQAAEAKNAVVRENHALAGEVARLKDIVRGFAARLCEQSDPPSRRAEKESSC